MRINHNIARLNTLNRLSSNNGADKRTWKNFLQVFVSTVLEMTQQVLRSLKNERTNQRS